jgi:asparagine synthase (glutamine-hydrolysing)
MCGICGEFSFAGEPVAPESIEAMATSIMHRGPDGSGMHVEGPIGLGHRRLSIIDLSPTGAQPMWSADGRCCITFNGEVYNYREIGAELESRGIRLRGTSDTEVVVNAVSVFGIEDALRRFIGMFAFAVWMPGERTLALIRDRVGVKPLFYWSDTQRVLFGSEARALMAHPLFRKRIDPVGIGQFFVAGYTLGEHTALANVRRVVPGHIVYFDARGRTKQTRYWSTDEIVRSRKPVKLDDAADELLGVLDSAVRYRLVSDVPVANFLSGGIDSSLVAALLMKRLKVDVQHITVGFDGTAFDESRKAERVAEELGLLHRVHHVNADEAVSALADFAEIYDEPFGDTSGIPTHILSRAARSQVKVALSADGGDEQFCGYDSYARYAGAWPRLNLVPAALRRFGTSAVSALPLPALAAMFSQGEDGSSLRPQLYARLEKVLRIARVRSPFELVRTMFEKAWTWEHVPALNGEVPHGLFDRTVLSDSALAASDDELLGRMMRADYQAFLRDDILTKVDRASMHVSLEARDPMLDHRLAEFAFRLPLSLVYAPGEHKRILKHLLRRWVSEDVVSSPKRGFSIPLYAWMRGRWKPAVLAHLSAAAVRSVGILNPSEVQREIDKFYRYAGGSAERIWMLLAFQLWAKRWLQ